MPPGPQVLTCDVLGAKRRGLIETCKAVTQKPKPKAEAAPKEGEAKEGEAKEGEAKEGEAKEGEAKAGEAKEGAADEDMGGV